MRFKITLTIFAVVLSTVFVKAQWNLTGNAATSTQFLGTTNTTPLVFKFNSQPIAILGQSFLLGRNINDINYGNVFAFGEEINFDDSGPYENSFAIGRYLDIPWRNTFLIGTGVSSTQKLAFGSENSLGIGFNSTIPTFFVGPSSGANTTGKIGIATTTPLEKLDVNGAIKLGTTTATNAGTLRYTGTDFEGYVGGQWKSFTAQGSGSSQWANTGGNISYSGTGNVGIGNTNPTHKLMVNGQVTAINGGYGFTHYNNASFDNYLTDYYIGNTFYFIAGKNGNATYPGLAFLTSGEERLRIADNGHIGFGTSTPENVDGWGKVVEVKSANHAKFQVSTSAVNTGLWSHNSGYYGAEAGGIVGTTTYQAFSIITDKKMRLMISRDGNVAIGTRCVPGGYMLAVKGNIICEGLKVKLENNGACWAPWPDYVFESNYKLLSLNEVEKFINENKHLPGVPSAKEIEQDGITVADMDATLLKKIEELTLYTIELQKQINELRNANK